MMTRSEFLAVIFLVIGVAGFIYLGQELLVQIPRPAPQITLILKEPIDQTGLPISPLYPHAAISAPVQFQSEDSAWLAIVLSDGRTLMINKNLIAGYKTEAATPSKAR